ncbi:MAG: hypothetical protein KTR30_30815 [Saprospiraceae bacterium]|nr:hypothetical protein [Saprospiraceae bacterium]
MIKFFRRIRRKLVEGSNVKKYLLYAAGEILLVVVGILIALQINTLNEANKKEKKTNEITKTLHVEVQEAHKYAVGQLELLDRRIGLFTNIINNWDSLDPTQLSDDNLRWQYWAIHTSTLIKYNPRVDHYNSMVSSGEINLVQDSMVIQLNYIYNSLKEEIGLYVDQQLDLQVLIAHLIAENYGAEFLSAQVQEGDLLGLDNETLIHFFNAIKTDGGLKSLLIRNLTAVKIVRFNFVRRVIPELEVLIESFDDLSSS